MNETLNNQENKQSGRKTATIVVACMIVIALLLYMFTFQVRFTEKAVVTTFGKPTRSISEPGLYWKWPLPIQNYHKFDARLQEFEGKLEQIFTSDYKNVIVNTYIGWRITDPRKYMSAVTEEKALKENLEKLARSYANGVISKHPFSHLISSRKDNRFDEIEKEVLQLLNEGEKRVLDNGKIVHNQGVKDLYGIEIKVFGIKKLVLPEKTTKAVFTRMEEERKRMATSFRSRGKSKAIEIKAQATSEEATLLANARAKAKEIRGITEKKAAEHYKIFAKNPELAIRLRKLEVLNKILESDKLSLMLDTSTPPFDLLHNPFPVKKVEKKEEHKPTSPVKDGEESKTDNTKIEKTATEPKETQNSSQTNSASSENNNEQEKETTETKTNNDKIDESASETKETTEKSEQQPVKEEKAVTEEKTVTEEKVDSAVEEEK